MIGPPANLTSKWWNNFLIFHPNHRDKSQIAKCRHCGKEVNYKNGSSGLKTHTMTHKHEIESIKVQFQNERNRKKRKFTNKLGATKKKSPEHRERDILDATVAWVVEENLAINVTAKKSFRRMIDQIDKQCPKFDARTIRSETEDLGEVCKEAVKLELKGKYISITTDHWTSKKTENYAVLTAHWIEGGNFKNSVLHFEHHRGRTKGTDLGREFSKIFDDYGFDLSYIVAVVTDTTGNMNTFGCYLQSKGVIHLYCVDHNIRLCAKLAYQDKNIPHSENVMKSARSLIEHFSSSTQASDKLMLMQKTISPSEIPKN